MCSWNCRGLFIDDSRKRALSLKFLRQVAGGVHILALQETHGLPGEVLAEIRSLLPGWLVIHSACINRDSINTSAAGGVAILISPSIASISSCEHKVLIPGRAQVASFVFQQSNKALT